MAVPHFSSTSATDCYVSTVHVHLHLPLVKFSHTITATHQLVNADSGCIPSVSQTLKKRKCQIVQNLSFHVAPWKTSHCLSSAQIHLKFTFCILNLLLISTFGEYIYIDVTKLDDFKRGNELFAVVRAHLMYTWWIMKENCGRQYKIEHCLFSPIWKRIPCFSFLQVAAVPVYCRPSA